MYVNWLRHWNQMAFNLKKANKIDLTDILREELSIHGVNLQEDGQYRCKIGDEITIATSLLECSNNISEAVNELRESVWDNWKTLAYIAEDILSDSKTNDGSVDNLLFLNSIKKSYLLTKRFSDLSEITDLIYNIFDMDIVDIDPSLVHAFNVQYLKVKLIHSLIMSELYKINIIQRYAKLSKQASNHVSGPWANLDLPMKERVWEWEDGEEEYFDNREKARKEQIRYNPEYNELGFYFVWQDLTRDPYRFEDMKKDSPYKSRHQITIP